MSDHRLTVVGLGPAGLDLLPAATLRVLEDAPRLILRTERHPAAVQLRNQGATFETLDAYYADAENFESLYPRLAQAVLARVAEGPVVYAVPGHPLLGEESVRLALAEKLGGKSKHLRHRETDGIDLTVDVNGSLIETRLTEWQAIVNEVLG